MIDRYCPNCSEWVETIEINLLGDIKLVLKELVYEFELQLFFTNDIKVKNIDNLLIVQGKHFSKFREAKDRKDYVLDKIFDDDKSGYGLYLKTILGKIIGVNYTPINGLKLISKRSVGSIIEDIAYSKDIEPEISGDYM